jgi:hypothetical protein
VCRCFRASCLGTANKADECLITQNIKTLVDLRSEKEFSTDRTKYNSTVFDEYDNLLYEVKYSKSGRPRELVPKMSSVDGERSRHMVSVIDEKLYKRGVFKKLGIGKKLKAAVYMGLSQTKLRKLFIDFINDAGLPLLNELILDYGGPSIKAVLDVVRGRELARLALCPRPQWRSLPMAPSAPAPRRRLTPTRKRAAAAAPPIAPLRALLRAPHSPSLRPLGSPLGILLDGGPPRMKGLSCLPA